VKRTLYSGVATTVQRVTHEGESAVLYIVVDPESGDQLEFLLNTDQAREDGLALEAAGR
jgi:hypothetical protein